MPPQTKISKEDVVQTAINLIRINGEASINARAIANALNCSTQPIFSNFSSMEELKTAVIESAFKTYLTYLSKEVNTQKYPPYKSYGIAYVRFAKEEKELFKLLFLCDRNEEDLKFTEDFYSSVEMIMKTNGFSKEKAELFHLEMWAFVHGIGTMIATSFCTFEWDRISDMISDVYQGLIQRHLN